MPILYTIKGSKTYLKELIYESDDEGNFFNEFPIYQIDINCTIVYNLIKISIIKHYG